jgi:hypothetical protein
MASTSETGNAKNIANYKLILSYLKEMDAAYNPVYAPIKLTALETKAGECDAVMNRVEGSLNPYKNEVNARDREYGKMKDLTIGARAALKGCGAGADVMKDARGMVNKVLGRRTGPKPKKDPDNPDWDPKSISQLSFDLRRANFSEFVAFLSTQTIYTPNETELKAASLRTYTDGLGSFNDRVNAAYAPLVQARKERDIVLYAPDTGISELTGTVKGYCKSVLGVKDPLFKKINGIKIKPPKKK